ncbi:stage IV sporulation protein A [Clostridia bacterium]|nr:stage IV sporulation protein A [Clostridia bacterium]
MEEIKMEFDLYGDIAERTDGDIYLGVVGPVRSGKSTFITRFMQALVLPNITAAHLRERTVDELPQSAAGKTVMTTQPKFIPAEAARVKVGEHAEIKVRLCDCVGYMIEGARGHKEDGRPRLVKTPWSEDEMPFEQAAEIGTKKVIADHSTVGVVVTSDGSINTDIPREHYIVAEERVIKELKELGKPFITILNTTKPDAPETAKLAEALREKYGVPAVPLDVLNMDREEVDAVLGKLLMEFPLRLVEIELPKWMQTLPADHQIVAELLDRARKLGENADKMRDYESAEKFFAENEDVKAGKIKEVNLGEGQLVFRVEPQEGLFYRMLGEVCGEAIADEFGLMDYIRKATHAKAEYDKIKGALDEVRETGYGVVTPAMDDMSLEEPEIVKQGNRFGVRLKASAPSLHIMRVDIETEVNPIVGTEQQSEDLVKYLLAEFENDPKGIWETNMFGKSLHNLVKENLSGKLHNMPPIAQKKMRKTLSRIVNEGKGGILCILL